MRTRMMNAVWGRHCAGCRGRVDGTVGTMSHLEEEAGELDTENMSAEDSRGTERTSLMVDKEV